MNQDKTCDSCPEGHADYAGMCLPQVDFTTFMISLASAAMVHLGEMPEPESGRMAASLPLAKHSIDTLAMLEEKTRGNLSDAEARQLADVLGHLRMLYVRRNA
ncbi:hypothetical protein NNJEOMEG_01827 [Fundidesulfovibrio magnetotacticus]|uniref:DUF1844 domain-containing protein n=1 Tax=Fundidesulfovibrio magnetotacticus TaxID=2730080 RepID=A0A6V8LV55_9BACT|nr:DUF1844 domain-containing protein [Fundidesulfovibrio magnetotacticus]GFK93989.1 hypothetical protein NNJEOMEG_01827 [Fundidesulfovibrio magnetotacticus]